MKEMKAAVLIIGYMLGGLYLLASASAPVVLAEIALDIHLPWWAATIATIANYFLMLRVTQITTKS